MLLIVLSLTTFLSTSLSTEGYFPIIRQINKHLYMLDFYQLQVLFILWKGRYDGMSHGSFGQE